MPESKRLTALVYTDENKAQRLTECLKLFFAAYSLEHINQI